MKKEFGFAKGGGYYLLDDINILKKMKSEWLVKYDSVDCCTPNINMQFLKNYKLVFSLGIVINEKRAGFQTSEYGWTTIGNGNLIKKYYEYFEHCDSIRIKN